MATHREEEETTKDNHQWASHHREGQMVTHREEVREIIKVSHQWASHRRASHRRVEISHKLVSRHRMKTIRAVKIKLILRRKRISKKVIKRQEIHPERRSNEKKICPNTGI